MRISDWTVVKYEDEISNRYIYGDLSDYQRECDKDANFEVIIFNDWTVNDCAEIIGNLLEDVNKHSMLYIVDIIKYTMDEIHMSEHDKKKFMQTFAVRMFERYGY